MHVDIIQCIINIKNNVVKPNH